MVTTNPPVVLRSLWKVVAMSDEPIDFDIVSDDGDNDAVFAKVSEAARRAADVTRRACDCGKAKR